MHYQLEKIDYTRVLPLLEGMPKDPMMHSVIEGQQAGQVVVDHPEHPAAALIWGGMEYAYLAGEQALTFVPDIKAYLENTILPAVQDTGFVSVFPPDAEARQALLAAFGERAPTCYGVDGYSFDADRFREQAAGLALLPEGYSLIRFDREALARPELVSIREDLEFCWETLEHFFERGLGVAVLLEGKPVSSCYTIGYGAAAYQIAICTSAAHRRKGLACHTATALIGAALEAGRTVYWQNDSPNTASRKLAERLGFSHAGVLTPVDIPAEPGRFHCGLAGHFAAYLGDYAEAERLYRTALRFNSGDEGALAGLAQVREKW